MRFIVIGGGCYGVYHSGQLYKAIQKGKLPADSQLIMVDRNAAPRAVQEHAGKPNFVFVQSDWHDFLMAYFADNSHYDPARAGDSVHVVPPPYAPHLFFDWLRAATAQKLAELGRRDIKVEREGFDFKLNTPYELTNDYGNHFMSRAGWTCPATCIEPHICPAIKAERDWDLDDDLRRLVAGKPVLPSLTAAPMLETANIANAMTAPDSFYLRQVASSFDSIETFTCHHFIFGIGTVTAARMLAARERMIQLALSLNAARPSARVAVGTVSHCHGVVACIKFSSR